MQARLHLCSLPEARQTPSQFQLELNPFPFQRLEDPHMGQAAGKPPPKASPMRGGLLS